MDFSQSSDIVLDHLTGRNSKVDPYWIDQLKRLDRSVAKVLIPQLTPDNELGFDSSQGTAAVPKGPARAGTLLDYTIQQKRKHPQSVVLIRSGEFYETYGIDALMLIAHAGLNPMGNKCKAGCPVRNVQATLDSLIAQGLSVAVYEEVAEIASGSSSKVKAIKSRCLTQIVSPASSTYIYDLTLRPDEIDYHENRPAVGILSTSHGYTLCQVYLDEQSISITERLSEEGVHSLLTSSGYIEPVFIQGKLPIASQHVERMQGYSETDFPKQLLQRIGRLLEVNTESFHVITSNRPRPIYTSTALQIGLLANDNVPSLLPALLPSPANVFSLRFLKKWILSPPPHHITDAMQRLCRALADFTSPLPAFQAGSVGKIVSMLSAKQCNLQVFRDIQKNANALEYLLQHEIYQQIIEPVLVLTSFECGVPAVMANLLGDCQQIGRAIDQVVATDEADLPFVDPHGNVPEEFFQRNEDEFRNKISLSHPLIASVYQEIETAARLLCNTIHKEYPKGAEIVFDMLDNSLSLRDMPSSSTNGEGKRSKPRPQPVTGVKYIPFIDRKGKMAKRYTTEAVQKALDAYVSVVTLAPQKVSWLLQELCGQLQVFMMSIVQSTHVAVIIQTALAHTISAIQKGWHMPKLVTETAQMDLQGLIPYWMPRSTASANDLTLRGIFLLTAPNMSGKSTLMRSVLVAALLANCGLFVPAMHAVVPRFDTFFLRTASYDVPSEDKSAFALEMDDMRVMMRDCSERSLIMIDELGKGTSARDGSALAGALLELLDRRQVTGIFATHLHEIFKLPLTLNRVTNKRMAYDVLESDERNLNGNRDGNGKAPVLHHVLALTAAAVPLKVRWAYQLEDGQCLDSMALITARQYQMDQEVISRAQTLIQVYDELIWKPTESQWAEGTADAQEDKEPPIKQLVNEPGRYDLQEVAPIIQALLPANASKVIFIPTNYMVPAVLEGSSCLYILHVYPLHKTGSSVLYVGETESLTQRLHQHRLNYRRSGKHVEALACIVADKSLARQLETQSIHALKKAGYGFDKDTDSRHRLFSQSSSSKGEE